VGSETAEAGEAQLHARTPPTEPCIEIEKIRTSRSNRDGPLCPP